LPIDVEVVIFAMLCQICQKRSAHIHKTLITGSPGNRTRTEQHLCEVCAGTKTELQIEQEQREWKAASEHRKEESQLLIRGVSKELWEPHLAVMKSNQIRTRGTALDPHWKLVLVGIDSTLPEVDPLNVLFGAIQTGTNHVVRQVKDCEVHIIRWHPDPKQFVRHLFEVFPQAGASLDLEKKLLFVEAERKLFPDPNRSLTFCNLASYLLGLDLPRDDRFRFRPGFP
jgi:hypothetical protein